MGTSDLKGWGKTGWEPGRQQEPFAYLQDQINRAFEGRTASQVPGVFTRKNECMSYIQITNSDSQIRVSIEVTGIDPRDFELILTAESVLLRSEKRHGRPADLSGRHWSERRPGPFDCRLSLAAGMNPEQVRADFKNGVPEVRLPRRLQTKARTCRIKIG